MTASKVKFCQHCLLHQSVADFSYQAHTKDRLRTICRAGMRELCATKYRPARKYPDGVRRYNCKDCGQPCEVVPQAMNAVRCPSCQAAHKIEYMREKDHERAKSARAELDQIEHTRIPACNERCPHYWWCCVAVMVGRALPCAPNSGGTPTWSEVIGRGALQSNWNAEAVE